MIVIFSPPTANVDNLRGFRIKLYPTDEQKQIFIKSMGFHRYVYNWAIDRQRYAYQHKEELGFSYYHPSDLSKEFQELRKRPENEWMKSIPLGNARESIRISDRAYDMFFRKLCRYPKYKSKRNTNQSFYFRNDKNAFYFSNDGMYVKIPGLSGRNDMVLCKTHSIPIKNVRYYRCTVKFDGYDYWLCVNAEVDRSELQNHELSEEVIGIDLGVRNFAVLSNGKVYNAPNTRRLLKRKQRLESKIAKAKNKRIKQCRQARTKLDEIPLTKNEEKLKYLHYKTKRRIFNIEHSFVHKITKEITDTYPSRIVIEDLDIRSMQKQHYSRGKDIIYPECYYMWGLFAKYIKYKSEERGIVCIKADKSYKSTQICSRCGHEHKLGGEKIYKCPNCGLIINRDLNAAINLSNWNQ